jgi:hypothetical protein
MAVYVNNITINTGEYFSRDFYLDNVDGTPLNLVGYAASSYIRKHPESLNPTAKFNVGFIDRDNGRIRVSLASSITKEIKPGRYVYDVLFTDTEDKKSIVIEGNVLATDDISTECKFGYPFKFGALVFESNGTRIAQSLANANLPMYVEINPTQMKEYGVIRMGLWNDCDRGGSGGLAAHVTFVQNNLNTILDYIQNGGVFIVNGEHGICGNAFAQNQIFSLLGSEIRCVGQSINAQGLVPKNSSISGLELFPDYWNFAASDHFTGGTTLYSDGNRLIVFEKIGSGVVIATADVNTYTNNQTDFSGDGPHPNQTVYEAFRSLVSNF